LLIFRDVFGRIAEILIWLDLRSYVFWSTGRPVIIMLDLEAGDRVLSAIVLTLLKLANLSKCLIFFTILF